jgi:hypothetical protein
VQPVDCNALHFNLSSEAAEEIGENENTPETRHGANRHAPARLLYCFVHDVSEYRSPVTIKSCGRSIAKNLLTRNGEIWRNSVKTMLDALDADTKPCASGGIPGAPARCCRLDFAVNLKTGRHASILHFRTAVPKHRYDL